MAFSRQEYWSGLPFPSPRGQESKLSFRHSESGALKGKETTRNVQACAVFRLSCLLSGKEREKLLPLFLLLTATLSAHSHLTFSSPSASNSKQRELSAKEAQEARRGRGGVPCHPQRRVQDTGRIGLLSWADCKGPHFLKQQKSPPPSLCCGGHTGAAPSLTWGPAHSRQGLPARRVTMSHVSADSSELAGGEHAFPADLPGGPAGCTGPGARSNPQQRAHF